jgi:hypothetical protein
MKKLSLIFIAIFGVITFASAYGYNGNNNSTSSLNLTLWNHAAFSVVFDNHTFAKTTQFDLANITPGIHHIQVITLTPNSHGYGGLKRILYNGTIKIPKNSEVKAVVNKHRKLDLRIFKNNNGHYSGGYHNQVHQSTCGFESGYSCSCIQSNGFNDFGYEGNNGNVFNPYYENTPIVISEASFNQLLRIVGNTSFDATKLVIVKQALRDNYFTTEHIAILMNQFSFDSHKLALAKVAYEKTVDKHNYFMVNEQFTFGSSVENLNNYLLQYA